MFILNNQIFKTKVATQKAIQEKIKLLDICVIDKTHKDYYFFEDLISYHEWKEEKIGCGIKAFKITYNPYNRNERTVYIIRVDNTEIDFSYKKCLGIKKNELTEAMRNSISSYTIEEKKKNKLECNYCKIINLTNSEYHLDHKTIPFSTIKDNFLKETTLEIPKVFDKDKIYLTAIFKDNDIKFKEAWINYHNLIADYQILCKTCNIKKSNK
jgi:5-methylcytosine-specific restriction endonuclease McrA